MSGFLEKVCPLGLGRGLGFSRKNGNRSLHQAGGECVRTGMETGPGTRNLACTADIVKLMVTCTMATFWKALNTTPVKICPNPKCRSP